MLPTHKYDGVTLNDFRLDFDTRVTRVLRGKRPKPVPKLFLNIYTQHTYIQYVAICGS